MNANIQHMAEMCEYRQYRGPGIYEQLPAALRALNAERAATAARMEKLGEKAWSGEYLTEQEENEQSEIIEKLKEIDSEISRLYHLSLPPVEPTPAGKRIEW